MGGVGVEAVAALEPAAVRGPAGPVALAGAGNSTWRLPDIIQPPTLFSLQHGHATLPTTPLLATQSCLFLHTGPCHSLEGEPLTTQRDPDAVRHGAALLAALRSRDRTTRTTLHPDQQHRQRHARMVLTIERAGGALGQSGVWFTSSSLSRAGRAAGERCAAVVLLLSHPTPPAGRPSLPA